MPLKRLPLDIFPMSFTYSVKHLKREWGWEGRWTEREIRIIFCYSTSIWMFKVPISEMWRHSFTHMTECESVKFNVEQASVPVVGSVLRFDRL